MAQEFQHADAQRRQQGSELCPRKVGAAVAGEINRYTQTCERRRGVPSVTTQRTLDLLYHAYGSRFRQVRERTAQYVELQVSEANYVSHHFFPEEPLSPRGLIGKRPR